MVNEFIRVECEGNAEAVDLVESILDAAARQAYLALRDANLFAPITISVSGHTETVGDSLYGAA